MATTLAKGVEIGRAQGYAVDERYPWYGVHATAVNRCRGSRVTLTQKATRSTWTLDARACDDGAAFRYIVPGAVGATRTPDEATTFRWPEGAIVWSHDFEGHYEGVHARHDVAARAGGRVGGAAAHGQAAAQRRLRLDHRVGAGRLWRPGAARGWAARLRGAAGPRGAGVVSLPAPLQTGRRRAAVDACGDHRHHHVALARGDDRPDAQRAGQRRHRAQPRAAARSRAVSARASEARRDATGSSRAGRSGAFSTAARTRSTE